MARITKKELKLRIRAKLNSTSLGESLATQDYRERPDANARFDATLHALLEVEKEYYTAEYAQKRIPVSLFHDGPKDHGPASIGNIRPFAPQYSDTLLTKAATGAAGSSAKQYEKVYPATPRRDDTASERVALAQEIASDAVYGEKGRLIPGGSIELRTSVLMRNGKPIDETWTRVIRLDDGTELSEELPASVLMRNGKPIDETWTRVIRLDDGTELSEELPADTVSVHNYSRAMKGANNFDTGMPTFPRWSESIEHVQQFERELKAALKLDAKHGAVRVTWKRIERPLQTVDSWGNVIPGRGACQSGMRKPVLALLPEFRYHVAQAWGLTDDGRTVRMIARSHADHMANVLENDALVAALKSQRDDIRRDNAPLIPTVSPVSPGPLFNATFASPIYRPKAKWFHIAPPVLALRATS